MGNHPYGDRSVLAHTQREYGKLRRSAPDYSKIRGTTCRQELVMIA